ncbi:hypothetical protein G6321_00053045 [Bradyrhizobium barranii subsp. barranii]|uniref:Phytase-like domain-containing protein n=1 Tax=Bradyrhizobium barranii subsp. barranii TaxID=2823807 RepID=A0A7Z0Q9H0_9BRAD|nr:esterase-like activity of phytase family protein [Bradyrhizobium barranii]UGX94186.1 hypothetical protein G6321_00053045 [Bradyrhizobium barranii subsp. barranii]
MSTQSSRRSFLGHAAAGFSTLALSRLAQAQPTTEPPPRAAQIEHAVTEPVSVEVNARPIPNFEPRDRSRVRFGQLQYRSGLVLTSPYRGFGGLSGIRLDAKGERFLAISDQGGWFTGINIRIRSIPLKSIAPNALVDGPALFTADLGHEVDNMEGIDAHVTPDGETVLTLVSDDNFSMLQRTLLLQFTLVE